MEKLMEESVEKSIKNSLGKSVEKNGTKICEKNIWKSLMSQCNGHQKSTESYCHSKRKSSTFTFNRHKTQNLNKSISRA